MCDEPLESPYLTGCPSYLFIASSRAIKRLLGRWPLVGIMDPDMLLGSYPLRFSLPVSFWWSHQFCWDIVSHELGCDHVDHVHCSRHMEGLVWLE